MKNCCLLLLVLQFLACQSQQNQQNASSSSTAPQLKSVKLQVADFAQQLAQTPSPQLIDVRTPAEFQSGHLDGAINIDFYEPGFNTQLEKLDKNQPIFVYCKSGGRSGKTAKRLQEMSFEQIYDLQGGYKAWSKVNK